jgi:uncharacterized protein (DUF427 family)
MKAFYKNELIAESPDAIEIEKDFYFPVESVNMNLLKKNNEKAACENEGDACYYDIVINGYVLKDEASSFSRPLEASEQLKDYIVFGNNINIVQ